MMPTLAEVSDLAEFIGEDIADNSADGKRALWALRAASALVRDESGRTWLTPDGTDLVTDMPDSVVAVTVYCAARVFENRSAQTSAGLDDSSDSWKVQEAGAYLTASERSTLANLNQSSFGGLGTVSTTRRTARTVTYGYPTDTDGVQVRMGFNGFID